MGKQIWGLRHAVALGMATAAALAVATPSALASAPSAQITRVGSAPGSESLSLVLPLKTDKAGLQRFATAVSTPGSAEYGQFESIAGLVQRFGAPVSERARVVGYLRRTGATGVKIDGTGLFADATMSVGLAQRLFGGELAAFRTASAARFVAPTRTVRIPAGLAGAVTGVVGLDTRPLSSGQPSPPTSSSPAAPPAVPAGAATTASASPAHGDDTPSDYPSRTGTGAGCPSALSQAGFTPNQYLTAYGYEGLYAGGFDGGGERVALIEINGYRLSDVQAFASCFGFGVPKITAFRVGVKNLLPAGGESTLDLEVLDAAAPGLKGIDVYESHPQAADVLRAITVPLVNRGRKPDVISASLGDCEKDTKEAIGGRNLSTVEASLELAAASGISVLASSGDDGSTACLNQRGVPEFFPAVNYPASSRWVTGVGGTNFMLSAANQISSQVVWDDDIGAGGGGISTLFHRPSWQTGFATVPRRVVPDVAMLADPSPGYEIYCTVRGDCLNKKNPNPWVQFGGTSAGTPLLAGGLALIDQDLREHGRQDIGLADPLLYQVDKSPGGSQVFSDVTIGDNDLFGLLTSGAHAVGCCTAGPGFDAASGLGSVNLSALAFAANGIVRRLVSVGLGLPRQRRPVRAEHLLARVSCSGRCLMGAYASFQLGRHSRKRITEYSNIYLLTRRSSKTIRIGLDKPALRKLRSALRHHDRITATIYGAIVDPSGNIERRTHGRSLHITG